MFSRFRQAAAAAANVVPEAHEPEARAPGSEQGSTQAASKAPKRGVFQPRGGYPGAGAGAGAGAGVVPGAGMRPPAQRHAGPDGEFLRGRNRFGSYAVPPALANRLSARQVLRGGLWEGETVDFLRRSARRGDIVLGGASFGPMIPAVSRALAEGCQLWAFEPDPDVFPAAEETARLNGLDLIELHDVALSDTDSLDYLAMGTGARAREMLVSAVRLDAVIGPQRPVAAMYLGFCRGLQAALTGAQRLIASRRPVLILDEPVEARWICERICGGYEPVGRLGRSSVYRCP